MLSPFAAAGSSAVSQTPREQRVVMKYLFRVSPRRLLEVNYWFTPAPDLCSHQDWLEEETFLPSPLTESQHAAFRVHPTSYRPRVTVAAMNHIAAAVRGAKEQFPFLVAQRPLSFQAYVLWEYEATSAYIASCKEVLNQSRYKSGVHLFWL